MEPTQSFWLNNAPLQNFRSTPELPSKTDVVIIGGGITGVSIAYWLCQNGISVTLLERRGISSGATGRNGGQIHPSTVNNFSETIEKYGIETARALWAYAQQTVEAIKAFVTEHNVECELCFKGCVSLALNPDELQQLLQEAEVMVNYGLGGEYWDASKCAEQLHSKDFLGGLFLPTPGQLWPTKLVFALAEQAIRLGANIQTQTTVKAVENNNNFLRVKTARGSLKAQQVVYATNAWARDLVPFVEGIIVPVRGQVLITEPVNPMWDFSFLANFGYEYCMQRLDGRIVLGGMRWLTPTKEVGIDDDTAISPTISQGLREFLPRHFPNLSGIKVEQEWTGIMGFSRDDNPLIGPVPHRSGEYIAAGFTGHGMPMAFLAGKAVASMIMGREPDVFVDAFLPSRFVA